MTIREANRNDLTEILQLYLYLHEESVPEDTEHLQNTWEIIINDVNHHLIVCEINGKIVASCVCVIIPNDAAYRFEGRKYIKFLSKCWV
ncbi:GNAT family N-acetyltransferase [Petralouisia muris]|jgi:hypothetical protein|uniref:hypothetical protein n=1 Tax=Petralouisia muris TaxID=3032872 RepID=UPI0026C1DEB3